MKRLLGLLLALCAGPAYAQGVSFATCDALSAAPASNDIFIMQDVDGGVAGDCGSARKITASNLFSYLATADAGGDTTTFCMLATAATGTLAPATDAGCSYNANTNVLSVPNYYGVAATVLAINQPEKTAAAGASQAGAGVTITADDAVASTDTAGAAAGGDITFTAGAAARNTSGNADAGDYEFVASAGIGTGTASQLTAGLGVAGAPAYSFIGDENTGLYAGGADQLNFATGGTSRFQVTTSSVTITSALSGNASASEIVGFARNTNVVTTTASTSGSTSFDIYTNTGDTDGATVTLLNNPTIGVCHKFIVDAAQTFTVVPDSGETLYMGTDQCVTSMTANATGASFEVCAFTGGSGAKWGAFGASGWTCND